MQKDKGHKCSLIVKAIQETRSVWDTLETMPFAKLPFLHKFDNRDDTDLSAHWQTCVLAQTDTELGIC